MEGDCVAMQEGARVRGLDNRLEALLRQTRLALAPFAEKLVEDVNQAIAKWSQSPEAEQLRELSANIAMHAEAIIQELERLSTSPEADRVLELESQLALEAHKAALQAEKEMAKSLPELERQYEILLEQIRSSRAN